MGHGERVFQVSCIQLQLQLAVSLVEQISINFRPITFRISEGDFLTIGFGDLSELSWLRLRVGFFFKVDAPEKE